MWHNLDISNDIPFYEVILLDKIKKKISIPVHSVNIGRVSFSKNVYNVEKNKGKCEEAKYFRFFFPLSFLGYIR